MNRKSPSFLFLPFVLSLSGVGSVLNLNLNLPLCRVSQLKEPLTINISAKSLSSELMDMQCLFCCSDMQGPWQDRGECEFFITKLRKKRA